MRPLSSLTCIGLLFASVLIWAIACSAEPSSTPAGESSRTATPAATMPPSAGSPTPPGLTLAQVKRVIDGDTIEVNLNGQSYHVRYIGIDTPETVDPRRPVQCFGREASERNRQLVEGKTVGLEKDVSETDHFGRLLRYIWADGRMVNAVLVEEGYATVATFPPDVKYAKLFVSLQTEAREASRGLWAGCATPSPSRTAGALICDYSGTTEPLIKGNISLRTGEKIYHVPGGAFYDDTVIDETKGERWFCTEGEAIAAGWRKSKQ